jgi:hypothetical protein
MIAIVMSVVPSRHSANIRATRNAASDQSVAWYQRHRGSEDEGGPRKRQLPSEGLMTSVVHAR